MLAFRILSGPMAGARFTRQLASVEIGRTDPGAGVFPDIDLAGADPGPGFTLSRRHARLSRGPDGARLHAHPGAGASLVNGVRVPADAMQGALLRDGDVIRMGNIEIAFEDTAAPRPAAPAQPAPPPAPPLTPDVVAPVARRVRPRRLALVAAGALGLAALVALAAPRQVAALPELLRGDWSERACGAFPVSCRNAAASQLAAQARDLDALAARLDDAGRRLAPVLAGARDDQTRLGGARHAIEAALAADVFPANVAGARYASAAPLRAQLLEVKDHAARAQAQLDTLGVTSSELARRRAEIAGVRADVATRLALLPVADALRDVEQALPSLLQANAGAALLRQDGIARRDEAEALLRTTDQLLGAR